MFSPVHPGGILREEVVQALGLSISEAARRLGVSRVSLSRVLNEHASISTNLAVRLEKAGVSSARMWLTMQTNFDLAVEQRKEAVIVERLVD